MKKPIAADLLYVAEKALELIKNTWPEEHGSAEVGIVWGGLEAAIKNAKQNIVPAKPVIKEMKEQYIKWMPENNLDNSPTIS